MRRRGFLLLAIPFLVVLGLVIFLFLPRAQAAPSEMPAPAWQLKDPGGKTVQFSDFKGKVVVLDFWATWCPPCLAEIPEFIALQKKYGEKGLVVVGVSMDEGGTVPVARFVKNHGVDYPIVMGDDKISADYGDIMGLPTTFVIDRQGKIVARHEGPTAPATFEQDIAKLL
jgi:thiol-disulfide isomerase/thioredoxin